MLQSSRVSAAARGVGVVIWTGHLGQQETHPVGAGVAGGSSSEVWLGLSSAASWWTRQVVLWGSRRAWSWDLQSDGCAVKARKGQMSPGSCFFPSPGFLYQGPSRRPEVSLKPCVLFATRRNPFCRWAPWTVRREVRCCCRYQTHSVSREGSGSGASGSWSSWRGPGSGNG